MGFIDFENINIPARQQFGMVRLDFKSLANLMLKDYLRVGCTVYLPDEMKRLSREIGKQGLETVLVSPGKSVDGRLILDLLVNAQKGNFDIAVIASGDRDYVKVVQEVQQLGKKVEIVSFSSNLGPGLRSVAGECMILDEHASEFVKKPNTYKCDSCGKDFALPFKLYENQLPALCRDCYKSKKRP